MLMTFKEFKENSNGYVALVVDDESKQRIYDALKSIGVTDGVINKLHMTLMFDKNDPVIPFNVSDKTYTATIKDITTLGDVDSKWYAVVLKTESPEIDARFKQLVSYGYKHSHDGFIQHVSLIYGPSEDDTKTIIDNKQQVIDKIGKITLGNEYTEAINKPDPETA